MSGSSSRSDQLNAREVSQLQRSLHSGSIRELALTVCAIRQLAAEVKAILYDLDESNIDHVQNGQMRFHQAINHPRPIRSRLDAVPAALPKTKPLKTYRCTICLKTLRSLASLHQHKLLHHASTAAPGMVGVARPLKRSFVPERAAEDAINDDQGSARHSAPNTPSKQASKDLGTLVAKNEPVSDDLMIGGIHLEQMVSPGRESHTPSQRTSSSGGSPVSPNQQASHHNGLFHNGSSDSANPFSFLDFSNPSAEPVSMRGSDRMPDTERNEDVHQLLNTLIVHNQEGRFQCPHCNHSSFNRQMMKSHIMNHCGLRPYACDMCSYKTAYKTALRRHYALHTGKRPHKCPLCNLAYIVHCQLVKHMQTSHPGNKPYKCDVCAQTVETSVLLSRHMRDEHASNSQETPYVDMKEIPSSPDAAYGSQAAPSAGDILDSGSQ